MLAEERKFLAGMKPGLQHRQAMAVRGAMDGDCHAAFSHLRRHADEWGCDPDRIAIGGDSAGGNLALATAMSAKGVWRVVAIYPVVKLWADDSASWRQYAKGYGDDAELLGAFCEAYANGQESNPLVSVGLASDGELRALPARKPTSARRLSSGCCRE